MNKRMKRAVMFAWLNDDELGWLFTLEELESNSKEYGYEYIADGLHMLMENMNENDIVKRDKALRGLSEEGLIALEYEAIVDELEIKSVHITLRGRKLLEEAGSILKESGINRESLVDVLKDFGISLASGVLTNLLMK